MSPSVENLQDWEGGLTEVRWMLALEHGWGTRQGDGICLAWGLEAGSRFCTLDWHRREKDSNVIDLGTLITGFI